MLPVNVLVLSFLMVVVVSTMLALYRSAVAGLIAPLLQTITDSSRYGTSTGYEPRTSPRGVHVERFAGSRFEDGSVVTSNVTSCNCDSRRYIRSPRSVLRLVLLISVILSNANGYALVSSVDVKSMHFASAQLPPLNPSYDALAMTQNSTIATNKSSSALVTVTNATMSPLNPSSYTNETTRNATVAIASVELPNLLVLNTTETTFSLFSWEFTEGPIIFAGRPMQWFVTIRLFEMVVIHWSRLQIYGIGIVGLLIFVFLSVYFSSREDHNCFCTLEEELQKSRVQISKLQEELQKSKVQISKLQHQVHSSETSYRVVAR